MSRYVEIPDGTCRVIIFGLDTKPISDHAYDPEDRGAAVREAIDGEWIDGHGGAPRCSACGNEADYSSWEKAFRDKLRFNKSRYCSDCGALLGE